MKWRQRRSFSAKAGDALGRASWRSPFLVDAGANFFCEKLKRGTKKEKSSKKERKEGPWKLTLLTGIRTERGFPQQLEKSLAKDARLFHSSHRPINKDLFTIIYCRQRSTFRRAKLGSARMGSTLMFENKDENRRGDSIATLGKGATSPPSPDPLTC